MEPMGTFQGGRVLFCRFIYTLEDEMPFPRAVLWSHVSLSFHLGGTYVLLTLTRHRKSLEPRVWLTRLPLLPPLFWSVDKWQRLCSLVCSLLVNPCWFMLTSPRTLNPEVWVTVPLSWFLHPLNRNAYSFTSLRSIKSKSMQNTEVFILWEVVVGWCSG